MSLRDRVNFITNYNVWVLIPTIELLFERDFTNKELLNYFYIDIMWLNFGLSICLKKEDWNKFENL